VNDSHILQGIGDGDDAVEASSATLKETEEGFQPVFFEPRPLVNLRLVDEVESLSPIMDIKVNLLSHLLLLFIIMSSTCQLHLQMEHIKQQQRLL